MAELTWVSIEFCIWESIFCSHDSRSPPLGAVLSAFCLNRKLYFSNTSEFRNSLNAASDSLQGNVTSITTIPHQNTRQTTYPALNFNFLSATCTFTVGATTQSLTEAEIAFSSAFFVFSLSPAILFSISEIFLFRFIISDSSEAMRWFAIWRSASLSERLLANPSRSAVVDYTPDTHTDRDIIRTSNHCVHNIPLPSA